MHIHDENLVHRDLKPANVLLSAAPSGGGEVNAKVADVGLARAVRGSHKGNTRVMRASKSQGAGTITYMAPEQIEAGRITQKVDVFAFGILMNELETGVMPWDDMPDMREWPSFFCPPALDLGHERRVPTRRALWLRPPWRSVPALAATFKIQELVVRKQKRPSPVAGGKVGALVKRCWHQVPKQRPEMSEVHGEIPVIGARATK